MSNWERLKSRVYDKQFYPKLRKLEGADFNSPFNFAWTIDFPGIFGGGAGFDIIVGNPPFVTARNPEKRELWRERWPRVCAGTYQLVCPFFELGFGLLRPGGQLGFIVSNAFAKREFGKVLVQNFFSTVALQKIVDCSGLLFPGHGTPTCLVFGQSAKPDAHVPVRVAGIKAGGGDLRTPPENSPLWRTLEEHHDLPGFEDLRIVVADRPRVEMTKWPVNLDASSEPTVKLLEAQSNGNVLLTFAHGFGSMFDTHKDDVFMLSSDSARRHGIEQQGVGRFVIGDQIRNWQLLGSSFVLRPYDSKWQLLKEKSYPRLFAYLKQFRAELGGRATFGGGTYDEAGQPWYRYHQMSSDNISAPFCIVYPEISTHGHFIAQETGLLFTQTAPLVRLKKAGEADNLVVAALMNSSSALFWLKTKCFNKGAGEDEHLDRFEYAGAKVVQTPVPPPVMETLNGNPSSPAAKRLIDLSRACQERGRRLSRLALKGLFEKRSEAYQVWNSSMPGYQAPDPALGSAFETETSLRDAYNRAKSLRDGLRLEMIELQEAMDWVIYGACGFLPQDHPAVGMSLSCHFENGRVEALIPLDRAVRPCKLWERAEGDYGKAADLIPADWTTERRALWEARLAVIRDDVHIRRIEQPVYKRRWDEQWKVGNQWRSGNVAYAAEFVEAFEWWLREKAEWWLEHRKNGGPVELNQWANSLWKDARVEAAWAVVVEEDTFLQNEKAREKAEAEGSQAPGQVQPNADLASFARFFKHAIDEETVPGDVPWAMPYDDLEKKRRTKVPAKVRSVRGKLNVPRERFHLSNKTTYSWAGLQFRK